jgi:hypothetical protein
MSIIPAAAPGTNRKGPPGVQQAISQWHHNANKMPYRECLVYNGTGGPLTKGAVYGVTMSGASQTTQNPRLQTVAINGGRHQTLVVALEATADATWARVCDWGYVEALVEGTTDVAADDALVAVPGQTYLIKAGGSGVAQVAEALEAQTANSAVLTDIFFAGQENPTQAGAVQYTEVSLTNTNMLALRATPITVVAAPGAGRILEFVSGVLFFDYTAAYTETADNLAIRYTDGSGAIVSQTIETTNFLDATADTMTTVLAKIDAIAAKTGCENQALVIHNTGGDEFGGGNAANAVRVKVAYRIHVTSW